MFHHILALLLMLSVTSKAANDYDYTLEGAIAEMNSQPLKRLPPIFLDGNPEAGNGIYIEIPNMSPFRFCIEDSVGNVADHTGVDYSIIGLRSKAALNSLKIKPSNGVILPGPDQNLDGWWYIRRGRHSKPERLLRVGYRGDHGWRLIVEAAIRSSKAKFGRLSDLRDGMIIVQRAGIRSWSREFAEDQVDQEILPVDHGPPQMTAPMLTDQAQSINLSPPPEYHSASSSSGFQTASYRELEACLLEKGSESRTVGPIPETIESRNSVDLALERMRIESNVLHNRVDNFLHWGQHLTVDERSSMQQEIRVGLIRLLDENSCFTDTEGETRKRALLADLLNVSRQL